MQVAAMSLFWIHCNRCYQRPASPEAKFYVTNCGHIYCRNCAGGVHKGIFTYDLRSWYLKSRR